MAPRKAKSRHPAPQDALGAGASDAARPDRTASTAGTDSNRLLREAAWSRMFGRIETKNPFTR